MEDSGPLMAVEEDSVAEGVEGAPRGDGEVEEEGEAAEGASEEGVKSWLSHTDTKVFIASFLNFCQRLYMLFWVGFQQEAPWVQISSLMS